MLSPFPISKAIKNIKKRLAAFTVSGFNSEKPVKQVLLSSLLQVERVRSEKENHSPKKSGMVGGEARIQRRRPRSPTEPASCALQPAAHGEQPENHSSVLVSNPYTVSMTPGPSV